MSENAEKGTSACVTLFGERSNFRLCLASHARILSRACNVWWVMLKDVLHFVPFLTTLDGKSAWKGDLYFFFFAYGDLLKCSESTIYTQRRHGDKRALERLLCLFHAQYDTMYIMIIWLLPVAFNCRQLLKVRADRRKNGSLRKYHYSKIQNAGDCVARTGVREIGFKVGSLPHDPGGITCMCLRPQGLEPHYLTCSIT